MAKYINDRLKNEYILRKLRYKKIYLKNNNTNNNNNKMMSKNCKKLISYYPWILIRL
jgi:hypothetical protein